MRNDEREEIESFLKEFKKDLPDGMVLKDRSPYVVGDYLADELDSTVSISNSSDDEIVVRWSNIGRVEKEDDGEWSDLNCEDSNLVEIVVLIGSEAIEVDEGIVMYTAADDVGVIISTLAELI